MVLKEVYYPIHTITLNAFILREGLIEEQLQKLNLLLFMVF